MLRKALIVILACVVAFCGFGFLASFEPGVGFGFKYAHGTLSLLALSGVASFARSRRAPD